MEIFIDFNESIILGEVSDDFFLSSAQSPCERSLKKTAISAEVSSDFGSDF